MTDLVGYLLWASRPCGAGLAAGRLHGAHLWRARSGARRGRTPAVAGPRPRRHRAAGLGRLCAGGADRSTPPASSCSTRSCGCSPGCRWNPDGIGPVAPDLAFNTAISFVTNTNWQAYSGEAQLSYFSQMVGLTVQNFLSAGTGMAVAVAVIRGFTGPEGRHDRQLLERPDPLGALGAAAAVAGRRADPALAGRAADAGRRRPCHRS